MTAPDLFDETAAGVYVGGVNKPISPRTFQRWRQRGCGPQFLRIGSQIRYHATDLDAWLATRTAQSTAKRNARLTESAD